jgi:hypothetical protein
MIIVDDSAFTLPRKESKIMKDRSTQLKNIMFLKKNISVFTPDYGV